MLQFLSFVIYVAGSLIFSLLGMSLNEMIPYYGGSLVGLLAWNVFFVAQGFRIVPQGMCWGIERLGKYVGVKTPGPNILLFPGVIDKIREVPLTYQHVDLYVNEDGSVDKNASIDFEDLSAPVTAQVWFIINPSLQGSLKEAVRVYLYTVDNPKKFIGDVVDASLRHDLSKMTFEKARKSKSDIMDRLAKMESVETALATLGLKLRDPKGILITDIVLPPELEALQALAFKGERESQEAINRSKGYADAIQKIIEMAKQADHVLTWDQAQELYFRNKGLEAYSQSGANSTFLGGNITDMIKALVGDRRS